MDEKDEIAALKARMEVYDLLLQSMLSADRDGDVKRSAASTLNGVVNDVETVRTNHGDAAAEATRKTAERLRRVIRLP